MKVSCPYLQIFIRKCILYSIGRNVHRDLTLTSQFEKVIRNTLKVVHSLLLQVDIDIKLRSCKGSCERYSVYQMEVGGYMALEKQVKQSQQPNLNQSGFFFFYTENCCSSFCS